MDGECGSIEFGVHHRFEHMTAAQGRGVGGGGKITAILIVADRQFLQFDGLFVFHEDVAQNRCHCSVSASLPSAQGSSDSLFHCN
jgi:hypothetical protein